MKYAKQISVDAPFPYLHKATVVLGKHNRVLGKHGTGVNGSVGVTRRYLPRKQIDLVKEVLPEAIRDKVIGVNYSEITLLAPHVHVLEQSVINFYQATNGEITKFYEGEIEPDLDWSADNGNAYYNVNINKIKCAEEFIAKPGDVWLLNSRQPHSVEWLGDQREGMWKYEPNTDDARWMVQVYIDLPYEEVAAHFGGGE